MTELNFITIKDHTSTNPIWGGNELYIMATTPLNISSSQIAVPKIKNFQNINVSEDGDDYAVNYDRRKSYINYGGFNNSVLTLTSIYNPITIGTTFIYDSVSRTVFTPSKLYELILQPRTIYIKDEFLIRTLLSNVEGDSPIIYSDKGIPAVLTSWSLTPSIEGKEVIMKLDFIEDKEI